MNTYAFIQASQILTNAYSEIESLLTDTAQEGILIQTQAAINAIKRRLDHLGGVATAEAGTKEQFPPITNFMGDPIGESKLVDMADLTPGNDDKLIYQNRVDALYRQFDSIATDGILNAHSTPEDQLVLRGVAKKAGLEDYRNGALNVNFIERINKGIKQQEANRIQAAKDDAETIAQERVQNLRSEFKKASDEARSLASKIETAEKDLASAPDNKKAKAESKLTELRSSHEATLETQRAIEQQLKDANSVQ